MIERLHIQGFRSFEDVELSELGQVNLLVGPGNSGKTNLLEAVFLFSCGGDAKLIPPILGLRRVSVENLSPRDNVAHIDWFWSGGRQDQPFRIEGIWQGSPRSVTVMKLLPPHVSRIPVATLDGQPGGAGVLSPLAAYRLETRAGDMTFRGDLFVMPNALFAPDGPTQNIPAKFVSSLEQGQSRPLASLWSEVEQRGEDQQVIALLRSLDSHITGVKLVADELGRAALRIQHERLGPHPVEFEGAGIGKALSIAAGITAFRGGLFLVDEIDASLHIGAQPGLIELLLRTAMDHGVQVFASTHSIETVDAFLDAYLSTPGLFTKPEGFRVLQVRRAGTQTEVKSLDAEKARRLREDLGFDLRRTE
jgi:hypothetical protein